MEKHYVSHALSLSKSALITFTIENFSRRHAKRVKCPVKVSDIDWVVIYSLGDAEFDQDSVEFYLRLDSKNGKPPSGVLFRVSWSVTLEKVDGSLLFISHCIEYFGERGFSYNHQKQKIPEEVFVENGDEILLNDALTVLCQLEITYDKLKPLNMNPFGCNVLIENLKNVINDPSSSDVTLVVRGKEFHVHKLMLCARSPVFEAMFKHNMVENRTGVITIEDMLPQTIEDLLQYIYTGTVEDFDGKKAVNLYHAADKYELDVLKEECAKILLDGLSVDIVCDAAVVADLYGNQKLMKAVKRFAMKNYYDLYSTKSYFNLINTNPRLAADILRNEEYKN